ncbi:MAG: Na+ dependent nucleoside transporter N-terminal domain-containing protein, partial [Pseudomonadota bacterium]
MPAQLISFVGIAVLFAIAVACSSNRRAIRPRIVIAAFLLQALLAVLTLKLDAGQRIIEAMSNGVMAIIGYVGSGIGMIFGNLYDPSEGAQSFAVEVLPVIVFFASLMAVLYHIGIMQLIVRVVGRGLQYVIGTRPVESLNAAANIFVGQTEAPLVVRPYLKSLTEPQLFALMVSGT